ncbi:hypothetical protein B0H14DRAFT_2610540 [Mycena olivaceomarginata]|nr:hypothetical protein B0H14DRAFT_2610540 [Mycena olivaceomarginata]
MPSALILGSGSRKKVELSGVNGHFGSVTAIAAQELCRKPNNDVKNDAHYVGFPHKSVGLLCGFAQCTKATCGSVRLCTTCLIWAWTGIHMKFKHNKKVTVNIK